MHRTTAFALAALVVAAGACSSSEPAATRPATTAPAAPTDTVWICHPGKPSAPCTDDLDATVVGKGGVRTRQAIHPAVAPPADCFYVYPTVSSAPGDNAPRESAPEIARAVHAQAALFSQVCRVFVPAYRQITTGALTRGKYFDPAVQKIAYDDVQDAWRDYLAHDNDGRPFVLIGHSQGALMLTRLIANEIDTQAQVRDRLLSAILPGTNVTVATGRPAGGSFANVPACTATGQRGCVIAYSSYVGTPPSYALFGHTNNSGEQVLCTDPTRLTGAPGPAHPYVPVGLLTKGLTPLPGTGFVAFPGGLRVGCRATPELSWLQVTVVPGSGIPSFDSSSLGPAWGLHVADVTLALGDLVHVVRRQEAG